MKRSAKSLVLTAVFVLCAIVFAIALSSCFNIGGISSKKVAVTSIVPEEVEFTVSTEGRANSYQIKYAVYPENATDKSVQFVPQNMTVAGQYISVSSTGLVKGKKETSEVGALEIKIVSVSTPKVTASVKVKVENVSPTRIYFDSAKYSKTLGDEPFKISAQFEPSYASVNTEYTLSSDNEDVATVSSDGTITIAGRGSATITATLNFGGDSVLPCTTTIEVKYLKPQFSITHHKDDDENFEQVPGNPKSIRFSVVATGVTEMYSDPSPKITWKVSSSKQDTAATSGLNYTYTPEADVTAGDYTVTVNIVDADDQTQTITSEPIRIYQRLTADALDVFNDSDGGSYSVSSGDRIYEKVVVAGDVRYGDSYIWYAYAFDGAKETEYEGSTTAEMYEYILDKKKKPSADEEIGDGDFIRLGTSEGGRQSEFDVALNAEGKVFIFVVPVVGDDPKYDVISGDSTPYTVAPSGDTEIAGLYSVYGLIGGKTARKIEWDRLAGNKNYQVEIEKSDGTIEYYDSETDSAYFDGSSFVAPLATGDSFKVRVRTVGRKWSDELTVEGSLPSGIEGYLKPLGNTPVDLYLYNLKELGELLGYLRTFVPDADGLGSTKITRSASDVQNYDYKYEIEAAFAFKTEDLASSGGRVSKKVIYVDGSGRADDSVSYKDVFVATSASADEVKAEYAEALSVAFGAYCEAGSTSFSVSKASSAGAIYTVAFAYYVVDAPALTYYTQDDTKLVNKTASGGTVATEKKKGETLTSYYDGLPTEKEITVETGMQLYFASTLGLKPIAKAGSSAEKILEKAATALNDIAGDEMDDYEKAIAIFDYLANVIYYDHNVADSSDVPSTDASFQAEGAFGIGTYDGRCLAVCDGMSKAYAIMCYMAGIPSSKVVGVAGLSANVSEKGGHAWNTVLIYGKRYNVDLTWGSTGTYSSGDKKSSLTSHYYMLASDSQLSATHVGYGEFGASVEEEYFYYTYEGLAAKESDCGDVIAAVEERIEVGKTVRFDIIVYSDALGLGGLSTYITALSAKLTADGYVNDINYTAPEDKSGPVIVQLFIDVKQYIKPI